MMLAIMLFVQLDYVHMTNLFNRALYGENLNNIYPITQSFKKKR